MVILIFSLGQFIKCFLTYKLMDPISAEMSKIRFVKVLGVNKNVRCIGFILSSKFKFISLDQVLYVMYP